MSRRSESRERSQSRSRSRNRSRSRSPRDRRDVIKIENEDAAFLLGKRGRTKEKLERVSGAEIHLDERTLTLEIKGPDASRARARKYVDCVMGQRQGAVSVDEHDIEDRTIVEVPGKCVGFVTGSQGSFLRMLEEEFNTLMFFAEYQGRPKDGGHGGPEKLVIFGEEKGRKGAELKVKSTVESDLPGHYTQGVQEFQSSKSGFDVDIVHIGKDRISWALGRKGATRRKLAAASESIIQYIGPWAYIAGNYEERKRGREYLQWTMDQLDSKSLDIPTEGRDDCTVLKVPQKCVGYVTGAARKTLIRIEEEYGVILLFMRPHDSSRSSRDAVEDLAIFGPRRGRRGAELQIMSSVENKEVGYYTKGVGDFKDHSQWGTDTFVLKGNELSYALGQRGSTRRKLAAASNCIIHYIGSVAYFSGEKEERSRARKYMSWLLEQRNGPVRVNSSSSGILALKIPREVVGHLMGSKGEILRKVEEQTKSFIFMGRDREDRERLFICSYSDTECERAERLLETEIRYIEDDLRRRERRGRDYDDRSYDRGYDRRERSHDRYDRRERRRSYSPDSYDRRRRY